MVNIILYMTVVFNWENMSFEFYASPSLFEDSARIMELKNEILNKADSIKFNSEYSFGDVVRRNEAVLGLFDFILQHPKVISSKFTTSGEMENLYEIGVKEIVYDELIPAEVGRMFYHNVFLDTASRFGANGFKMPYTGLLIDARGIGFVPSFYPKVISEGGRLIYGVECVFAHSIKKEGFVGYTYNTFGHSVLQRVGVNPLRIIPVKASGCNLVISEEDALTILSSPVLAKWIKDCRILIVIDPPVQK